MYIRAELDCLLGKKYVLTDFIRIITNVLLTKRIIIIPCERKIATSGFYVLVDVVSTSRSKTARSSTAKKKKREQKPVTFS